jgi:glycosyltransferase involved in cell wall biosynthesis
MTEPLVSVITPFYNTEAFLEECIKSVICQTYQNWDYTLINNWSTDKSGEIADYFAARYPEKIRVVRPETFLSQVQNFNFALSCISPGSKYTKMVLADDWMYRQCLESMVELAETRPRVGIVASYILEGDRVSLDGLPYYSCELTGRDACRSWFVQGDYLFGSPTSLLVRSDLVRSRNPFYDERRYPFEDTYVCFDILRDCNFGFVHQVLTYSRRDNRSILEDTRKLGMLYLLRFATVFLHGRDCLLADEYEYCLKTARQEYFKFLGRSWFERRSKEFWEFHRNQMASLDYVLNWRLLIKCILLSVRGGLKKRLSRAAAG